VFKIKGFSLCIALIFMMMIGLLVVGCGNPAGDDTHTHLYGSYLSNTTQHWKECSCGEEYGRDDHDGEPCDICGYENEEDDRPGIPQNVTAQAEGGYVFLEWDPVEGAASYNVYITNNNDGLLLDGTANWGMTEYVSSTWKGRGTLYFRVRAVSFYGVESGYNTATVVSINNGNFGDPLVKE
jgi:hypothetical protein